MKLHHDPAVLVLTRQDLPTLDRTKYAAAAGLHKGAYVLADAPDGKPDVLLMATGSEVSLCVQAYEKLKAEGVKARVVSMPSWEVFEHQPPEYRASVLPPDVTARVAVEQASTFGWAALHRPDRRDHRHAHLRRLGPAQGAAEGVQFTADAVIAAREGSNCATT